MFTKERIVQNNKEVLLERSGLLRAFMADSPDYESWKQGLIPQLNRVDQQLLESEPAWRSILDVLFEQELRDKTFHIFQPWSTRLAMTAAFVGIGYETASKDIEVFGRDFYSKLRGYEMVQRYKPVHEVVSSCLSLTMTGNYIYQRSQINRAELGSFGGSLDF